MFVIRRVEDGKYVARFGSDRSYTVMLQKAQTFSTKDVAASHACGNEYVVSVNSEFSQVRYA